MLSKAIQELKGQGASFLRFLRTLQSDGANRSDYIYTLEEAIDATQEELKAAQEGLYPEIQKRTPPRDLPPTPPPARNDSQKNSNDEGGPPRKKELGRAHG